MAKKIRKKKKQTNNKRTLIYFLFIIFSSGIILSAILVFSIYLGAFGKLPGHDEIKSIKQSNASLVFASDGTLMGKYYEVNRQSISNEAISPYVRQALIATEDNRFFEHHGIDLISLGRVFFKSLLMGDLDQGGGSTISQQLAKNLFKRKDHGFLSLPVNKIREMFIASDIEEVYSKEEILTMYLNTISFGENVYGIEAAALRFYSKTSSELSISESATLIGMLAANTWYNPRLHPENALERRNTVFTRMHTQGFISEEEAEKLKKEPIVLNYRLMDQNRGMAPYFRQYIRREALKILDDSINLEADGLRIYTSLDKDIQSYAEAAIDVHMQKLQGEFDQHWKGREPWEKNPEIFDRTLKETEAYQNLQTTGMTHVEIMQKLSVPHKRNILTASGEEARDISTIDSLKHYLQLLNTGFLALDPKSGAILAWVGGINYQYIPYDHVLSKRQAGSTFKPFVYAAALKNGMQPCQYISNEKRIYEEYEDWSPGNSNEKYEGYYSLRGGLMTSMNTITAEIMVRTGPEYVVNMAHSLGINSHLPAVPSLALGTADVSLMEMLSAYTGFSNYGVAMLPFGITRIEDSDGSLIYEAEGYTELPRAFDESLGILMSNMLQSVVDSGTASSARTVYGLQSELAGKTGTTQNNADGWFIGFTPNIVAGAWVGAELPSVHFRTTALGSGAHMALPIFAHTIKKMESNPELRNKYLTPFAQIPDTLVEMLNCPSYSESFPKEHLTRLERRELRQELKEREVMDKEEKQEKKGFFRRIGDFFRKRK